jgi:translation elongation factor P/translation initiation factor 5A
VGQEYSKGENEMKIKLKRNISTGLAVRTTLKAGEKMCRVDVTLSLA